MVSIIIAVYKVEQYLRECIESVLGQTYEDIQVILVDDGSPDSCGSICDEYAAKDSRVLALHKENGGVSSARNYGLQYATGEYVTFCDSDDLYAPDWIEGLVNAIQFHQADVAVGNYIKYFENGSLGEASAHESGVVDTTQMPQKAEYIFNKLFTPEHGWEVCMRLFRMEIIRREKILFCETCGNFAEDLGFTLIYTLFADRMVSTEKTGYHYRIRSGSMMQTSALNPKLDSLQEVCTFCIPAIQRVFPADMAELFFRNVQFFLLGNQFSSCMWASEMNPQEFRSYVISNVADWPSMEIQIRELLKGKWELGSYITRSRKAEIAAHLYFLLGMPWIILRVQCKLIRMFQPKSNGR